MGQIIFGYHVVEEYLKQEELQGILHISRKNSRIEDIVKTASRRKLKIKRDSEKELDHLCGSRDHKGCALELFSSGEKKTIESLDEYFRGCPEYKENHFILILEKLTDPHNLGAILRSADIFGVDLVISTERKSVSLNDTVKKVSAGAEAWIPFITVTNLGRIIDQLKEKGFWIYGADMEGQSCHETDLKGNTALIMGSEGTGISRLTADKCDALIKIPMGGHIESLNVSVAAGILLYEAKRQRFIN